MDHLTVRDILDTVKRGQIRIPAFQRGFVWEPDRVAYLMDSIHKRYPFGSLLFWRTKEKLKTELDLGPFKLPSPAEDYPVDYVLDGQQRITSIFGTFQTELPLDRSDLWRDIYFDFKAQQSAQESLFLALAQSEVDKDRHFPLKALFDTVAYRKHTTGLDESTAKYIDEMQSVFKEVRIPVQMFKTEDRATVAIIFERINRQGVPLDTLQLLSAWTWSEEFQLASQFEDLADQLAPFGFADLGADSNLILRCCSAILSKDASPEALMKLNGQVVRERFGEVLNGILGAVDYVKSNYHVESLSNLPFSTILVPLSVFFAVPGNKEKLIADAQRSTINRWFWRACFSRRYSSGVLRNLKSDIEEMSKLRDGKPSALGGFPVAIDKSFFIENSFSLGAVNTQTFVLMLAQSRPLSFVSGAPIDLGAKLKNANRAEFHHVMPKEFLRKSEQKTPSEQCLANFAFISRSDNRHLGGVAPSTYKAKMASDVDEILRRSLCPNSIFADDYKAFASERSEDLAKRAESLCL